MIVFHGGASIIDHPLVQQGREGLDFGRGFYVTDIKKQAEAWANRMARIRNAQGIVNIYELDIEKVKRTFSYKFFSEYNIEWLEFIVANRQGTYHGPEYDLVDGGVANDRVIDTVEAYMADMMPIETALRNLAMHKPNNQLCIRNQHLVDECMKFTSSYNL